MTALTESTDFESAAFSTSVKSSSMICSMPFAPSTVGTQGRCLQIRIHLRDKRLMEERGVDL